MVFLLMNSKDNQYNPSLAFYSFYLYHSMR